MRRIHKIFLTGCGYAILLLSMCYAFLAIDNPIARGIESKQFILILSIGLVIAFAEFMYEMLNIKKIYKGLLHYFLILTAFWLVCVASDDIGFNSVSAVFIAIFVYTALYFIIWTIVHFVRKAINKADDILDKKTNPAKSTATAKKGTYKPLYSDNK